MKIKVLFFASFRELLDCCELEIDLPDGNTISELCHQLSGKGAQWTQLFENAKTTVKVSINQEMASQDSTLQDNDEVAFFPPVTGG